MGAGGVLERWHREQVLFSASVSRVASSVTHSIWVWISTNCSLIPHTVGGESASNIHPEVGNETGEGQGAFTTQLFLSPVSERQPASEEEDMGRRDGRASGQGEEQGVVPAPAALATPGGSEEMQDGGVHS